MSDSKNILQRINEVRKLITYMQKDKNVSTGQSGGYKALSHDAVTGMVREHMVSQGVVSFPYLIASVMNLPTVNVDGTQAKQRMYEATYDITFASIDNLDDKIVIRIEAHALDNADKAPGKALSYAKKYAVLKLFEIESGDDEESRYQEKETFDLAFYNDLLEKSTTLEELQSNYVEAKKESTRLKDIAGFKAVGEKTKKLKAAIEAKNATN